MTGFVIDVEADGPCPGMYSMIEIGIVKFDYEGKFDNYFHGQLAPMTDLYIEEALSVSGYSREQTLEFPGPSEVMHKAHEWISDNNDHGRPIFFSDNNGWDFPWWNYYSHFFLGTNIFGHSSRNIGDLYKGLVKDMFQNFKHLRKTKHDHNPVNDAKGNAEALLEMKNMGLRIGRN